ncbi:MAG: DUF4351 domain-containing protein [Leptolyngbyaceae bacterium]|nr:DUF4351 domain-containing protein [Leptolyngbyaceae bacterium]
MAILRQSPWYQEILQEGETRGEARGSKQAAMTILLKQLTRQLGIDAVVWRQRLEALSVAQLETLAEALFDFSSEADLDDWLAQDEQVSEL